MLRKFRSQNIIWDRASRIVRETIEAHAGDVDGRTLTVYVVDDGEIVDLTGSTLSLVWATKDNQFAGEDVFDDTGIATGEFELVYTAEMLSHAGKTLKASLRLVMDEEVIESKGLSIAVMKSNYVESAEQSGEFSQLQLALIRLADIESDESGRKAAELLRITAETDREAAEEIRESNESARNTAEGARDTAYGQAESARDGLYTTAEGARNTAYGQAEDARDGQYSTAEGARTTAFNLAETTRNANEVARGTAEGTRSSNETTRIANENARAVFEVYSSSKNYVIGNKVAYNGSSYRALKASKGVTPGTDDTTWLLIAEKGDPGEIKNLAASHIESALGYTPANATNEHTHTNKSTIDKFSEVEGKPYYNGEEIGGAVPNLTLNELILGGRFKIIYNDIEDSLDIEVV